MKELLLLLLPDEALPLIIAGLGIALILGIINRRVVFNLLGIVILFSLLSPFIDSLFESLPLWLLLLLSLGFAFSILKLVLNTVFGKEATGNFLGRVLFEIFALPFRCIGLLFRWRRRI